MLLDARHKDVGSTATYLGDAGTLKSLLDRVNAADVQQKVGRYDPIYVKTLANFASLSRSSVSLKMNHRSLRDLADWYVFDILKIDREGFKNRSFPIAKIVDCGVNYKPDLSREEKYRAVLKARLSPAEYEKTIADIEEDAREKMMVVINHVDQSLQSSPIDATTGPDITESSSPNKPKPQKNIVVLGDHTRPSIVNATDNVEKLNLLMVAVAEIKK